MEDFGELMTSKAREIGCLNTTFKNSHGLDSEGHISTAYDMAVITSYLYNNKILKEIINTKVASIKINDKTVNLKNTNRLLKTNNYVTGGKTGYTGNADRCLAITAKKDNFNISVVVLGAVNTDIRFDTANDLVNSTFEKYNIYNLDDKLNWNINIPVTKGVNKNYTDNYIEKLNIPLTKEENSKLVIKENIIKSLNAPVEKNKYIGNIEVKIDKETILYKSLYTTYDIKKMNISDYFKLITSGI